MSKGSGKQSRARRVEAVKAALRYVYHNEEMPSDFDERLFNAMMNWEINHD